MFYYRRVTAVRAAVGVLYRYFIQDVSITEKRTNYPCAVEL
jgi:hypothetical protein